MVQIEGAPKAGDIFAEKYRVERVLGMGGMGYVLAARHLQLDERVAIKMLLPERAQHAETVTRFLREGKAAVKIRSEHVGRVLDVASYNGTPYIVMEYLDGCDLAALLEHEGRLAREVAIDYVLQACEAIAEAHAARIIHRDLKPANLFLVRKADGAPCIKVLDFGISKMSGPEGAAQLSMTKTASLVGSPLYMSPEQLRSAKRVDERSDVWAIGVILFELMAGRPPFLAETLPELGSLVLSGNVPDLREFVPDAPPDLALAVRTCLRMNPADRFPSVAELAAMLAPFGTPAAAISAARIARVLDGVSRPAWTAPQSEPTIARAQTPEWLLGSTALEATASADGTPRTTARRSSRWPWALAGVLGTIAAGTAAVRFVPLKKSAEMTRASESVRPMPVTASVASIALPEKIVSSTPQPSASAFLSPATAPRTARPRSSSAPSASASATVVAPPPTPAASSAAPTNGFTNDRHE